MAAKLDAGLIVVAVDVDVDVGVDAAGVTSIVVVVVDFVGEGMTIPEEGNETTPNEEVRVGPWGWLRGTNTIPKIPARTKERETAHHSNWVGRFSLRDFTSPNLV